MDDRDISILVPFKPDNGQRDKIWSWVRKRYELLMPNAEICVGYYGTEPFSRAAAVNAAAKIATRDIFFIADNDLIFEMSKMEASIEMLKKYPWVVPYAGKLQLDRAGSDMLMGMSPSTNLARIDSSIYDFRPGGVGGISLVPRSCFEMVKGLDERFKGWGYEDNAFQSALDTICGRHGRSEDLVIWHFYHDRQPTRSKDSPTYNANEELYRRYSAAYKNKKTMQQLIDETYLESLRN